jgi:hypothetical protein
VNDSAQAIVPKSPQTIDEYAKTYDQLLSDALAANPKVKFVLCEPFFVNKDKPNQRSMEMQREVKARAAVVEKLAAKYQAPVVRIQKLFDDDCEKAPASYWIPDGVHPSHSDQLMAHEGIPLADAVMKMRLMVAAGMLPGVTAQGRQGQSSRRRRPARDLAEARVGDGAEVSVCGRCQVTTFLACVSE